jgi:hypothetical protein
MSQNKSFYALLEAKMCAAGEAPALESPDGAILTYAELIGAACNGGKQCVR